MKEGGDWTVNAGWRTTTMTLPQSERHPLVARCVDRGARRHACTHPPTIKDSASPSPEVTKEGTKRWQSGGRMNQDRRRDEQKD